MINYSRSSFEVLFIIEERNLPNQTLLPLFRIHCLIHPFGNCGFKEGKRDICNNQGSRTTCDVGIDQKTPDWGSLRAHITFIVLFRKNQMFKRFNFMRLLDVSDMAFTMQWLCQVEWNSKSQRTMIGSLNMRGPSFLLLKFHLQWRLLTV